MAFAWVASWREDVPPRTEDGDLVAARDTSIGCHGRCSEKSAKQECRLLARSRAREGETGCGGESRRLLGGISKLIIFLSISYTTFSTTSAASWQYWSLYLLVA